MTGSGMPVSGDTAARRAAVSVSEGNPLRTAFSGPQIASERPTRPYGLIDQPERPPEPGWNRPDVPYAPPSLDRHNTNEFHPGPGWRDESLQWLCGRRETQCEQEEGAA